MINGCVIRRWAPAVLLGSIIWAAPPLQLAAQAPAPASQSVTKSLLDKAHAFEQRGRMDLAEQTWQQVLLTDPKNTEALGGLARAAKLNGSPTLSNSYLDRLRAINPNDPAIAVVENMGTQQGQKTAQPEQKAQLQQAAKLAEAGKYAAAMAIYRRVFGAHPPPGDWALAYYETEAATPDGRPAAVIGLRGLLDQDPDNTQYRIALGRVLTYDPATREEGREYLRSFPNDAKANEAIRQSLLWDAGNPVMEPIIRAYLADHNDPQLAAALKSPAAPSAKAPTPAPAATTPPAAPVVAATPPAPKAPAAASAQAVPAPQPPAAPAASKPSAPTVAASTPARPPVAAASSPDASAARLRAAEIAAYDSLNANRIDEAESRFKAILATTPQDAKALAGMGYVRMQQGNFAGSIGFLEQARQGDPTDKGVISALDTARFWFIMGEGQRALADGDLTTAEKRYQAAVDLRPNSADALEGLGGTLTKAQQPAAAIPIFERAVAADPTSAPGWRGLFIAQVQGGKAPLALATQKRFPPAVETQLAGDPLFLLSLASAYSAAGQNADAQNTLEAALKLQFPADAKPLKSATELQLAGLLVAGNHLDRAAVLYAQVVAEDHDNTAAWQGLAQVQHALTHDDDALKTVESMPSASYAAAMRDPAFEVTVASVYQAEKKLPEAQQILQTAVSQQTDAGHQPSPALEMQLADVYVQQGTPQLAYPIYQQVLREHPDRADAWAGLVSALHTTGHDQEAVDQIKTVPSPVRAQLEANPAYLQTMASVYEALGRSREAAPFLNRVEQDYVAQRKSPPADVEIQNAWALYNGIQDADLYRQLMELGGRPDLSAEQRRTVQTIWTNWAVRRANQAAAAGNSRRAVAILNAAAHAFPDNPAAIKALAIGYAQAGEPHQAVLIYRAQNMSSASSGDYQAAIGSALSGSDDKDAEIWLRYALSAYPSDPQILILGAKFEQARGDTARAIKYYRASLKAMPPAEPGSKLTAELGLPAVSTPQSLPSETQPQDLSILLSPDAGDLPVLSSPVQPYLPAYPIQPPLPPYDGISRVVPPYMTNPGSRTPRSPSPADLSPVPAQAEVASVIRNATGQSSPPPVATPETYQRQQVAQLTQQAAAHEPPATQAVESSGEVYGPYVAYIPPPPTSTPAVPDKGVTGQSVLSVQLGNTNPAAPVRQQADMTDVLPTQRYAPSARANQAAADEPEVAAARAARIRRLQEESAARSGQSHPPDEIISDANYTTGPQLPDQAHGNPQVPQPPSGPGGQLGNIPSTGAQQYPQPPTQPAAAPSTTPRPRLIPRPPAPAPTTPAAAAPAPAPAAVSTPPAPPAPTAPNPTQAQPAVAQPFPLIGPTYPLAAPPTDAELRAHNLPALRGSFSSQAPMPLSPRQQAESELAGLEGSYSGWTGATGIGRYRSGTPGLDRLYDIESPVEASAVIARTVRVTAVAVPVFVNAGVLNTSGFTTSYVPYLGTLPANAHTTPAQQYSNGIGGELQLTTKNLGIAAGYTPYEFLVHNLTGRFNFTTLGDRISIFGERQPVKDTQLSYAGLRDPGAKFPGPIWGGVLATTGGARLELHNANTTFYLSGEGGELSGRHVLTNTVLRGETGTAFRVVNWPSSGSLSVGFDLAGMHYQHNEVGLSYGQGGYFSPSIYFRGSVPVTFTGYYKTNFHYFVTGAVGFQTFREEAAPFYPLDLALQASFVPSNGVACTSAQAPSLNCGEYPLQDTTAFTYAVTAEASYRFADHWYGGGSFVANNTNNYNNVAGGFFFRFVFSGQHSPEGYPPGLFRLNGLRPLQIP